MEKVFPISNYLQGLSKKGVANTPHAHLFLGVRRVSTPGIKHTRMRPHPKTEEVAIHQKVLAT